MASGPRPKPSGAVAGAVMAGQAAKYEGTLPSNVLKVVGIDLVAAGDIDADGKLTTVVHRNEAKKTYRKLVIQDNLLVGAILLGDIRGSAEIQAAIQKKRDLGHLKERTGESGF